MIKERPFFLRKHPYMKEIFNVCKGSLNDRENAAFILNQNTCHNCHSFNLQAEIITGYFTGIDTVRFCECTRNNDGLLSSKEVHVVKEGNNVVVVQKTLELLENEDAELQHLN